MKSLIFIFSMCVATCYAQNGQANLKPVTGYSVSDWRGNTGIAVDDTGRIWMSFAGFQLTSLKYYYSSIGLLTYGSDSTWTKIRLDSVGGPNTRYLSSIAFEKHALWLGSDNGLIRKKGSQFTTYKTPFPHLAGDTVNSFTIKGDIIYMAMKNGVQVCVDNLLSATWKHYDTSNSSLPTNCIYGIDAEANGILWLATNKGVIRFDPVANACTIFNKTNTEFKFDTILSIKVLPDGSVWAGSYRYLAGPTYIDKLDELPGLYKLSGTTFRNIISLLGVCNFKFIPKYTFNQIYNEGNKVVFYGTPFNYPALPLTSRFYAALYKTDGVFLEQLLLTPQVNIAYDSRITKKGNTFYYTPTFLSTSTLNLDAYKEDSTYYRFIHGADTITNPFMSEILSELDINNMHAPVRIKGDMFTRDWSPEGSLTGDKSGCRSLAITGAVWMGGIADGQLYLAAGTYRQSGIDYMPGPLRIADAISTNESKMGFNHAWKINQRTIDEFKLNYNKTGYTIPPEIQSWPAHGDSVNGFSAKLAPFKDLNSNGRYEPNLGEYPQVKGQQEVFWIFNDQSGIHTETDGLPLGVEVHGTAYAYVCDKVSSTSADKAINNATFYRYKIINRSNRTYHNYRFGFFLDGDLGFFDDDRLAFDAKNQYAYWYNGDTLDETVHGYGKNIPAAAIIYLGGFTDSLNNEMKEATLMTYYNDFSVMGNPTRPEHFYNYLNSKWKDGIAVTYGGSGRGGSDSIDVNMFPGTTDLLNRPAWSEETEGFTPGDRRLLLHSGGTTLKPGEEKEFEFAVVFTPTQSNDKDFILSELHKDVLKLKGWYATNSFPSCSTAPLGLSDELRNNNVALNVYPNPTTGIINFEMSNADAIKQVQIYSLSGILVETIKQGEIKTLDLSMHAAGMYIIKVQTNAGVFVKKVIRQ